MTVWHDRDDFWEAFAPFMFSERIWEAAPGQIDQILKHLALESGAAILDLACGPGRHSLELARRGFRVTGVDRTARFLDEARRRAQAENLAVEFVEEDMRRFARPGAYDAVLSLFTSFGYFEEPDENQIALNNMYRSLRPGGGLLMDLMGKEIIARIFTERSWIEQDSVYRLEERKISRNWSWIENRWILLTGSSRYETMVSHWLYSATELSAMLQDAGFADLRIYGDLDGTPYDHAASRLVVVARKPPDSAGASS